MQMKNEHLSSLRFEVISTNDRTNISNKLFNVICFVITSVSFSQIKNLLLSMVAFKALVSSKEE